MQISILFEMLKWKCYSRTIACVEAELEIYMTFKYNENVCIQILIRRI